jgi:hypothetical protein
MFKRLSGRGDRPLDRLDGLVKVRRRLYRLFKVLTYSKSAKSLITEMRSDRELGCGFGKIQTDPTAGEWGIWPD